MFLKIGGSSESPRGMSNENIEKTIGRIYGNSRKLIEMRSQWIERLTEKMIEDHDITIVTTIPEAIYMEKGGASRTMKMMRLL